jgi:hypothetical protein
MGQFANDTCFTSKDWIFNLTTEENEALIEEDASFTKGKFVLCIGRGPCVVVVDMAYLRPFMQNMTSCGLPSSFLGHATGSNWLKGGTHPAQMKVVVECLEKSLVPAQAISFVRLGRCAKLALVAVEQSESGCFLERFGYKVAPLCDQPEFARCYHANMNETPFTSMCCDMRFDSAPSSDLALLMRKASGAYIYPTFGLLQLGCFYAGRVVAGGENPKSVMDQANERQLSGTAFIPNGKFKSKVVESGAWYLENVEPGVHISTVVMYPHNNVCGSKHALKGCPGFR